MFHWIFIIVTVLNTEVAQCFSGLIAIHFFNRHKVFLNFQQKQAIRKPSGKNYHNRLQNLLWQKLELTKKYYQQESWSNKNHPYLVHKFYIFTKGFDIMWLNFPFKKGKDTFFCIREKDWYSDTKSYDKAVFAQQLSSRSFLREDRMKGT